MPSEEEINSIRNRQDFEEIMNRETVEKFLRTQEMEKAQRKRRRERFLELDLTLDEMFKQSCARVYYMKSRKAKLATPGSAAWEVVKPSDKLLSRFKTNKVKADRAEQLVAAAIRVGDTKQIEEYKKQADEYLKVCLHSHYGIGLMYAQFKATARLDLDSVPVQEDPFDDY